MKLKAKIQQVLVAQNCWRTNAIPKLPQQEVESSTDVDVDNISENVWRTKKSLSLNSNIIFRHNNNAADGSLNTNLF